MTLKRTPLYPVYAEHGGKSIDFGGWELPVQFGGIIQEHETVRAKAGLFDVSHMGEIMVRGAEAASFLQTLMTNDVTRLEAGQAQYSLMCYPDGGVVDDLLVYKLADDEYMLVVNAANTDKDFDWLEQHLEGDVRLEDISKSTALLALQGPYAERIITKVAEADVASLDGFRFIRDVNIRVGEDTVGVGESGGVRSDGEREAGGAQASDAAEVNGIGAQTSGENADGTGEAQATGAAGGSGEQTPDQAGIGDESTPVSDAPLVRCLVSRTGYTGEDGFELYVPAAQALRVWRALLAAGAEYGLAPIGLGARDTLRFEARLPLYGQELSPHITPLEAGLGIFVKLDKGDFIGREALIQQKTEGVRRKLVGIEMIDRGIPRSHYAVYDEQGGRIGEVTSGTQSPTLKKNVGLALIDVQHAAADTAVWVDVRGRKLQAKVVRTPFYRRQG